MRISDESLAPALHGITGTVVKQLEPHSEADPLALVMTCLTRSSAAIGSTAWVRVSAAGQQPPRINVLIVGQTARARKGTAEADVRAVFKHAQPDFDAENTHSGLASGEGLIAALERNSNEGKGGMLIIEPEFARTLTAASREGSTLSHVIRDLYDRGDAQIITRNSQIRINDAHVSIIGHITHDELTRRLKSVEVANGFANRFVFVRVERSKRLAFGGTLSAFDLGVIGSKWRQAIRQAQSVNGEVVRSPAASQAFKDWYDQLDDEVFGAYGNLVARAETHVARMSLIYALLDGSQTIEIEHHDAALAIWQLSDRHLATLYPPTESTGDPDADLLIRKLKERSTLSRTEVVKVFHGHKRDTELDRIIGYLTEQGLITEERVPTSGRPITLYHYQQPDPSFA